MLTKVCIFIMFGVTILVASAACNRSPATQPTTKTADRAVIRVALEAPQFVGGKGLVGGDVISITNPIQIQNLLTYFPRHSVASNGRQLSGAWVALVTIDLYRNGNALRTIHTDFEHWNDGDTDHIVKPGLNDFIRRLSAAAPAPGG